MSDVAFTCPHCKQKMDVPEEMLGQTINCPACQVEINLPKPNTSHASQSIKLATSSSSHSSKPNAMLPSDTEPRINAAISQVSSVLVPNEKIQAYAVQRRFFALTHRRSIVFATTGRFIGVVRGLFGGFSPIDVRWQDMRDAKIHVGAFGATLFINALLSPDMANSTAVRTLIFTGLRKNEAQTVYRLCQEQEQAWREKRRLRSIEELRAQSGGIQLGSNIGVPQQTSGGDDAMKRLQQAKEMLDKGLISDSEYETIKARIVSNI